MIDKAKLAKRIHELEGLTTEERASLLELLNTQKRYGLVWEEKEEEVEKQLESELPVLTEVAERRLPVVDDAPNHILIEGDNLHALTCLSYTHENSIDVIYIDPPYNTGNKDFVYNDHYIDTEDSFRHSKWLSFMSKRLRIAQQLLSDKGVIFISIDDNEQAALKLLCDEVFGERNFVNEYIWLNKPEGRQIQGAGAVGTHEYILAYCRNIDNVSEYTLRAAWLKELMPSSYKEKAVNVKFDAKGAYIATHELYNGNSKFNEETRPSLIFDIYYRECDGDIIIEPVSTEHLHEGYYKIAPHTNSDGIHKYHAFRWSREKILRERENLEFVKSGDSYKILTKRREFDLTIVKDIITDISTANGRLDIERLGVKGFSYPKPVDLLALLLKAATFNMETDEETQEAKEPIILDFFAGSGTTLHAVMQLNKEDGGKRQCILVTNNENGICENVTYERNRRVIQGYTNAKGEAVEGLTNNNLRYYRTEYVPKERSHHNRLALVRAATDLLCIKNNLYAEQPILINGKKLRKDIARSFCASGAGVAREMLIVYEPAIIPMLLDWIKERELEDKLKVYVFSDNRYAYEDDFKSVLPMIELCALPEAIYKAYQSVRKRKMVTTEALPEQENTEFQLELC